MMITHFFDTPYSSNSNVCTISFLMSLQYKSNIPVGASNNVILRLCDPVDQPSANMCANLCPAHLKSHRIFSIFCWAQPKMDMWGHRWQEASEFFCTKTPLFGESWATKNIAKKKWKCSLRRVTNVMFSKFRGWRRNKKTALRAIF